jgi:hypothetical protein
MKGLSVHERNVNTIKNYQRKRDIMRVSLRPSLVKVVRAVMSLKRRMDKIDYYDRQLTAVLHAADKGEPFRKVYKKKPRGPRMVDL